MVLAELRAGRASICMSTSTTRTAAEVCELPGCFASGDTAAELVESVEEAVVLHLAPPDADEAPPIAIKLAGFDLSLGSATPLLAA